MFCYADGKVAVHGNDPTRVGLLTKDLKDTAGKLYGEEILRVAEEGKGRGSELSVFTARSRYDTRAKIALVTKIADHVCAAGYYQ